MSDILSLKQFIFDVVLQTGTGAKCTILSLIEWKVLAVLLPTVGVTCYFTNSNYHAISVRIHAWFGELNDTIIWELLFAILVCAVCTASILSIKGALIAMVRAKSVLFP